MRVGAKSSPINLDHPNQVAYSPKFPRNVSVLEGKTKMLSYEETDRRSIFSWFCPYYCTTCCSSFGVETVIMSRSMLQEFVHRPVHVIRYQIHKHLVDLNIPPVQSVMEA